MFGSFRKSTADKLAMKMAMNLKKPYKIRLFPMSFAGSNPSSPAKAKPSTLLKS